MSDKKLCDSDSYIPRKCAESFCDLQRGIAKITELTRSVDENLRATSHRLEEFGDSLADTKTDLASLSTAIGQLRHQQKDQGRAIAVMISAGWRVAVILVSVVASVLGLKNILGM